MSVRDETGRAIRLIGRIRNLHDGVNDMRMMFARCMAAIMGLMMLAPLPALAEAVQVTAEVKAACVQAGGEVLPEVRMAKVVSPYGTQSVVLRDVPSDSYHAVAMLMVGQKITVGGTHDEFCYVLLEDGCTGWLEADEVV